ncbi:MAG: error-prone DNA polymerase [Myxococcaceae bacterium]|nr:error-prone DNA polymerase [Myxococcaceae bacterium]
MMYAELVARSNYAFLRGASHPEELVEAAAALGLSGLAITDDDGLYGLVKAHLEAKARALKLVLASRLTLTDAPPIALYVQTAQGYAHLCELISESRLAHPKGHAGLSWQRVLPRAGGLALVLLDDPTRPADHRVAAQLAEAFPGHCYVGVSRHLVADDEARFFAARALSGAIDAPLLAHNDVHTHARDRQPLQDVMTAIRLGTTLAKAGTLVFPNAERTLKSPAELLALFPDAPEAVGRTMEIVDGSAFSLDDLRYTFSEEELPPGMTRRAFLAHLCEEGLRVRYPSGVPEAARRQVEKELSLIAALEYEGYFLALWDIVRFARSKGILCQGRGSAANSAVCYVLQITAIDPVRMNLLFERFLSMERKEPPDIDVDFEHARREEVLQYVYEKHGRHRAAMVCEHICFRGKLSVKEVGKALGLSVDQLERLSKAMDLSDDVGPWQLHQAGLSASDLAVQQTMALSRQLSGMPRHLSIHVGGFVITHGPLVSMAPVEAGAMQDRTVVQWEKDDLSALDILKVDLLGLGMLTVLARSFELIEAVCGRRYDMATVPAEDPAVYDMICEADTVGTFQIESRAQQNMLPRLKPRSFYDLVVEIAIIRPGPIVGEMVHPYLRRRNGEEAVTYPSPDVQAVLERTLGVPLFQEQAMKLAMVAAGFTPGDADALRRALTHKRAHEKLPRFRDRYVEGCVSRGYDREFAEKSFDSFKGFSHYGFPESHSASFALIAYVSSWLKRYYPAIFTAALLDAQPMGFYAPHTLVADACRHGVEARAVDVNRSTWRCQLELDGRTSAGLVRAPSGGVVPEQPALRLGFELVKGLREETATRLVSERERSGPFTSLAELARRTRVPKSELSRLVLAGALGSLTSSRRAALWELAALGTFDEDDLFFGLPMAADAPAFPQMSATERVATDFDTVGLSLESHPVGLLRPQLKKAGAVTAEQLQQAPSGKLVKLGGLVIVRQRPPTAKGFCFMSVEDETGLANLVIEPRRFEQLRKEITGTALVLAAGRVERSGKVVNLKVENLEALMP